MYYQLTTGLSRAQCTWMIEHFHLSAAGVLSTYTEYEDGFLYMSAPGPFAMPARVVASTEQVFLAVQARFRVIESAKRAKLAADKQWKEQMKSGNIYGDAAAAALPAITEFLADFTVLDLEFQGNQMLELAAIRYQNWQPVGQLQSFVRFTEPVSGLITNLTGIRSRDVANAPGEKSVLQAFRKLAGDSILVAHNISADRRVLEAGRTRLGATEPLANAWFCSLALAKQRLPAPHKLSDLCERMNIPSAGAHRALNDVKMTFQLLALMHQQQPITAESATPAKRSRARGTGSLFASAA